MESLVKQAYEIAKQRYAKIGVDVEKAIAEMDKISLSLHCWQTDDVTGFENPDGQIGRASCRERVSSPV